MKFFLKNISFLIIVLNYSCNSIKDSSDLNFGKVNLSNQKIGESAHYEKTFKCKDSIEFPEDGYSKLTFKNEEGEIINSYNDGYESAKIIFIIKNDLSIKKIEYSYSDDTEDGSRDEFEIIEAKINLNKNPFQYDTKDIIGEYYLKISKKNIPKEFWKSNTKEKITFKGHIICN